MSGTGWYLILPTTYYGHSSMQRLLSNYTNSAIDFMSNVSGNSCHNVTIPQMLEWSLATGDSPGDRAVPFMTLPEEYT